MTAWRSSLFLVAMATIAVTLVVLAVARRANAWDDCSGVPMPPVKPIYTLNPAYHHLPESFVKEFLAHPPQQGWFGEPIRCGTYQTAGEAAVNYCICFGATACSALALSERCVGEIGAIPSGRAAVCRVETLEPVPESCKVEKVTVG